MGHNYHSLSIDATIVVSENCPITGKHVGINFVTQYVRVAGNSFQYFSRLRV